jgi:DNA-binding protein H-NS
MSSGNNSSNHYYQLFRSTGSNDLLTQPNSGSPNHVGIDGGDFSPEDLHHILGVVTGDSNNVGHHFSESLSHSDLHSLNDTSYQVGHLPGEAEKAPSDCARTERKRSREKQRRFDVNKQFSELTAAVRQIEMETEEYRVPTMYSPNNRADLIARTVALLQALHSMNQKKQKEINELQEELQRAKLAGEEAAQKLKESMMAPQNVGNNKVIMMVPMMMNADGSTAGVNPTAAPVAFPPMPFPTGAPATTNDATPPNPWGVMPPWMMQHMMMPQAALMVPPAPPMSGASNNSSASSTSPSGEPKVAPSSSAADGNVVGSNLAHCA